MPEPALIWERLVAITGTDDPNEVAYFTGLGYAQATRYKSGTAGAEGPSARQLQTMVEFIASRTGRLVTMGQVWGSEPLPDEARAEESDAAWKARQTGNLDAAVGKLRGAQAQHTRRRAQRADGGKA